MKEPLPVSENTVLLKFSCFLFVMLAASLACAADSPPSVSISLNPAYAAPGDTITIQADASDDYGVMGIYFYFPNSSSFTFQNCSNALTCTRSVSAQVTQLGDATFCVRAIDNASQLSDLVCGVVGISVDRPPIIEYFQSEQKEGDVPSVSVGGTIKFEIVAEDDNAVATLYIEDVSAGTTEEHDCGNLKTCDYEYKRFFTDEGVYSFCVYAVDNIGQNSTKKCIQVNAVKKETCEPITLNDGTSDQVVALTVTSKRLYLDRDGLLGYSAQCCEDQGFCDDLQINSGSCQKVGGSLPDKGYVVVKWDPKYGSIEDLLQGYKYPQVLCTTVMDNSTYVGVVDNYNYKIVGQTQNLEENLMTYWLMGELKNVPPEPTPTVSRVLIYTTGTVAGETMDPGALKGILEKDGYQTDLASRPDKLTPDLLSKYGLVWIMETTEGTHASQDEIDAVIAYRNNDGGLVLSGEGDSDLSLTNKYVDFVNDIANGVGVTFSSPLVLNNNWVSCAQLTPVGSHPVISGVSSLSSTGSDAYLTTNNSDVKVVATFDGKNGVMALDGTGGQGRIVFDSSEVRFLTTGVPLADGPNSCDNAKYIANIVNWVGVKQVSSSAATASLPGATLSDGTEVDKYFFAEQLQKEDNETKVSVIVDDVAYSDAMNRLLQKECMDKQTGVGRMPV